MLEVDKETTFLVTPSVTEVFQRVNSTIPEDWDLDSVRINPYTTVSQAFDIMQRHRCSQLPVMVGNEVLGYFSYQSFSTNLMKLNFENIEFRELPVEEFLDNPTYLQINDEIRQLISLLEKYEVAFIGLSNRLQAVLTPMDAVRFLHELSYPFIVLGEIELALRNIIRACVTGDELIDCIQISFEEKKKRKPYPSALEDMTYHDYLTLLGYEENWQYFDVAFGVGDWPRSRTLARLDQVREYRNVVFHFKHELSQEERQTLLTHRDWLLRKARVMEANVLGR